MYLALHCLTSSDTTQLRGDRNGIREHRLYYLLLPVCSSLFRSYNSSLFPSLSLHSPSLILILLYRSKFLLLISLHLHSSSPFFFFFFNFFYCISFTLFSFPSSIFSSFAYLILLSFILPILFHLQPHSYSISKSAFPLLPLPLFFLLIPLFFRLHILSFPLPSVLTRTAVRPGPEFVSSWLSHFPMYNQIQASSCLYPCCFESLKPVDGFSRNLVWT